MLLHGRPSLVSLFLDASLYLILQGILAQLLVENEAKSRELWGLDRASIMARVVLVAEPPYGGTLPRYLRVHVHAKRGLL